MSNNYKFLNNVNFPSDIRKLSQSEIKVLADEVRQELIDVVSETGGHLGAGLGVVELTVALHYVFNTPKDKLVWDVSHQCYPHKIITGRKKEIYVSSAGKNIAPLVIEETMKSIPLVSQCFLVGDNKNYCTALITLDVGVILRDKFSMDSNKIPKDPGEQLKVLISKGKKLDDFTGQNRNLEDDASMVIFQVK